MIKKRNSLLILLCVFLCSCSTYKFARYKAVYSFIVNDYKESGTEEYYKKIIDSNAYGFLIYDTIFEFNPKKDNYILKDNIKIIDNLITDESKRQKSSELTKLSNLTKNSEWRPFDKYEEIQNVENFKGPTFVMVFSSFEKDSLRVDVFSGFTLEYCGTVSKYLFVFKDKKIESTFKRSTSRECW